MNKIVRALKEFGCNVEKALERCVDDEELYTMLVQTFADDQSFNKLGDNIKNSNLEEAFNDAHTIKGVAANLEITPIYDADVVIVEKLRAGTFDGVEAQYKNMMNILEQYKSIVS
jgi:HPt (histidine-containing phosphotransfer) domain-containing protein